MTTQPRPATSADTVTSVASTLPYASVTVSVRLKGTPTATVDGPLIRNLLAAPDFTVMPPWVAVSTPPWLVILVAVAPARHCESFWKCSV